MKTFNEIFTESVVKELGFTKADVPEDNEDSLFKVDEGEPETIPELPAKTDPPVMTLSDEDINKIAQALAKMSQTSAGEKGE